MILIKKFLEIIVSLILLPIKLIWVDIVILMEKFGKKEEQTLYRRPLKLTTKLKRLIKKRNNNESF